MRYKYLKRIHRNSKKNELKRNIKANKRVQ